MDELQTFKLIFTYKWSKIVGFQHSIHAGLPQIVINWVTELHVPSVFSARHEWWHLWDIKLTVFYGDPALEEFRFLESILIKGVAGNLRIHKIYRSSRIILKFQNLDIQYNKDTCVEIPVQFSQKMGRVPSGAETWIFHQNSHKVHLNPQKFSHIWSEIFYRLTLRTENWWYSWFQNFTGKGFQLTLARVKFLNKKAPMFSKTFLLFIGFRLQKELLTDFESSFLHSTLVILTSLIF